MPSSVVRSKPAAYPGYVAPCLASNIGKPPAGGGWAHEIKLDGFRTQLHLCDGEAALYSKGGHDWTARYRAVAQEAATLPVEHAVVDGEIVVCRADGTSDFWRLQEHIRGTEHEGLAYYAFDLLFLHGEDLRRLPLFKRKAKLAAVLASAPQVRVRYSEHIETDGPTMWTHAHGLGVEGIVSKRLDAPYRSGRGEDWIKTPCEYRETLLVAGMAFDGEAFDGLYLARRSAGGLAYAGKIKAEAAYKLTPDVVADLRRRLDPLVVPRAPVSTKSPKPGAQWVCPVTEIQVVHRGGFGAERVRRPIFEGVVAPRPAKMKPSAATVVVPPENVQRELPDAIVPSKAQLQAHWRKVGKLALPHLANRLLTLVRHADGLTFFHMGPLPPVPPSVRQMTIRKADGSDGVRLYVDSLEGLLGLVELGVVEVHPWAATVDDIERPDHMIIDLDPGEGIPWEFVVETAFALRDVLADEGYVPWPKLTGGTGLHLMVPIELALTHREVHGYALELADRVAARDPARYTTSAGRTKRRGKLFLDCLRNGRGSTAVGAYSPRARPGVPVAAPVTWLDIEQGVRPDAYRLDRLPGRRRSGERSA